MPRVNAKHVQFLARTVLVKNNDVETAYLQLNRILRTEGIIPFLQRDRFNEKPFMERNRLVRERVDRILSDEVKRKISFVLRKNRPDPHPR